MGTQDLPLPLCSHTKPEVCQTGSHLWKNLVSICTCACARMCPYASVCAFACTCMNVCVAACRPCRQTATHPCVWSEVKASKGVVGLRSCFLALSLLQTLAFPALPPVMSSLSQSLDHTSLQHFPPKQKASSGSIVGSWARLQDLFPKTGISSEISTPWGFLTGDGTQVR